LFYRPDLLHFAAFFVTDDNFVFRYESFGAVSAILNSDIISLVKSIRVRVQNLLELIGFARGPDHFF
jgi:hypothetical protein